MGSQTAPLITVADSSLVSQPADDMVPDYVILDGNGQVPVRLRVHIMSLHQINTVDQQFDCKAWIQLMWLTKKRDLATIREETEWKVLLQIQNEIGDIKLDTRFKVENKSTPAGECTAVYYRYLVQGTFAERFELQDFPFDFQRLHLEIAIWHNPSAVQNLQTGLRKSCMRRLRFFSGKHCIYAEGFVQLDAWKLHNQVYVTQGLTAAERNDGGLQYCTLQVFVCAERKISFYIWNVIFPVFFLVLLSFISFFMDVGALADRMTITLTLLLTLVAFKFVVSQYLPATSYLTYLDKYVVLSFLFLFLVAGQNLLCHRLDIRLSSTFNNISSGVLAGSWILLNLASIVICMIAKQQQQIRELGHTSTADADHEEVLAIAAGAKLDPVIQFLI